MTIICAGGESGSWQIDDAVHLATRERYLVVEFEYMSNPGAACSTPVNPKDTLPSPLVPP